MGGPHRTARILCGDGWYGVLERGMSEIQSFCDLCSEGTTSPEVKMEVAQEREGALCFYHSIEGADSVEREILGEIIREMELSSAYFCEFTGASPASLCRRGPRLRTLSYEVALREDYELWSQDYAKGWRETNPSTPHPAPRSDSRAPRHRGHRARPYPQRQRPSPRLAA